MTIREHLERALRRIMFGAVAMTLAITIAFHWRFPHAPRWQFGVLGLVTGAVVGPGVLILGRIIF